MHAAQGILDSKQQKVLTKKQSMSIRSSYSSTSNDGPGWDLEVIIGRNEESKLLTEVARNALQSTIILHGAAGSGKSSLVHSQPWGNCIVATGKFEQHGGEPFSAWIEALNGLVDQWVVLNSMADVCRMGGFRELLDEDFIFMRNILPKAYQAATSGCSVWSSKFSAFPETNPPPKQDLCKCVNMSFIRIIQFLCKIQPVILFLDDLHWADKASLNVLKFLASGAAGTKVDNLNLIVSYRDEEVTEKHPTMITINKITTTIQSQKPEGLEVHDIHVKDLSLDNVNLYVASITRQDAEVTLPLATVIHQKTAGNPFFVTQFLLMLRREQFLTYSYSTYKWEWGNIERLEKAAHISENVADVIASSLTSLPPATQVAIKVASCLGKIVPLNVLVEYFEGYDEAQAGHTCSSGLHHIKESELRSILETAVQRGILLKPENSETFRWAHDKLQHVSYSLIPDKFRPSLHIKLGTLLWRMSSRSLDSEWMVFMAADQLNRFSDDLVLGAEVAQLCLKAANLSLTKSALWPAHKMLLSGAKHLNVEDKWTTHYDLSLELYSSLAELSIHLNKSDEALEAVKEIQQHAKSLEDKFRSQCVMLMHLTSGRDRNYQLGSQTAIDILRDYGVKFPNKLFPGQMLIENTKFKRKLPGAKLTSMLDLPDMTDKRSLQIMKLLTEFCALNIFLTHQDKNLAWYAMVRALSLSVDKGICEHTGLAVMGWAISLKDSGHYKEADEYAELALRIMERFPYAVGSLHSRVNLIAAGTVFGVTRPFSKILDLWTKVHGMALRQGETEIASSAILGYSIMYIMIGLPLDALRTDLRSYELEARQFHLPETITILYRVNHQTIINLQDDVSNPAELKGEAIDEDETLKSLDGPAHRMTKRDIYTYRLLLALIFGYWDMAETLMEELEPYGSDDLSPSRGLLRRSLRGLAAFKIARTKGNKKHRATGRAILKEIEKDIKNGNVNAYSFYLMLQAEELPTKEKYDKCIRALARAGCVNFEAYMCERAGEYFLERNDVAWGEYYLSQALVLYEEWGARGKASRMKTDYSPLLDSSDLHHKASTSLRGRTRYTSEHSDQLKSFRWDQVDSASTLGERTSLSISREGDTSTDRSSEHVFEDNNVPGSILLP